VAESAILGVLGLFVGRFLNLTIDRLPPRPTLSSEASPNYGSPTSNHPPLLVSLLPLVGHFWSHASARPETRIPLRYPVVEILTAGLCALIGYQYGLTLSAAVLIVYCALFVHFTFVDLEHSLILNKVVLPALPLTIALFPFSPLGQSWDIGEAYLRSLEGAGLGFGIMLLVYIASRGGTGAGDVKLAALLGAILGFPQIAAGLPVGFVIGGLVGMVVLVLRLKGRKDSIPFGPSLVAGTTLVLLGGAGVYGWYLDLFR
jgi:leader peptidase (prepilin peptidase)/N-methyltransferase